MPSFNKARRKLALRAFRRGEVLRLDNPHYSRWVKAFTLEMVKADLGDMGDLTTQALLGKKPKAGLAIVEAQDEGILAGLEEVAWFYSRSGLQVEPLKKDGEWVRSGEIILKAWGKLRDLFKTERAGLNLLQRMSGIATTTRRLMDHLAESGFPTLVTATRKTPWGLLDKRAVHLGGGGSHRLGLWEAVLIKGNHLKALGDPFPKTLEKVLLQAGGILEKAAFIEVETGSNEEAVTVAHLFKRLQSGHRLGPPCILMLDNFSPHQVREVVSALKAEDLYEWVLLEASGGIDESSLLDYAASGVDAASLGFLTHSTRALDFHQVLV